MSVFGVGSRSDFRLLFFEGREKPFTRSREVAKNLLSSSRLRVSTLRTKLSKSGCYTLTTVSGVTRIGGNCDKVRDT